MGEFDAGARLPIKPSGHAARRCSLLTKGRLFERNLTPVSSHAKASGPSLSRAQHSDRHPQSWTPCLIIKPIKLGCYMQQVVQ
jgi:hypothetical protein